MFIFYLTNGQNNTSTVTLDAMSTFFSGSISSVFDHNCCFCHRPLSLHVKCLAGRGNVAVSGCCKHLEASSDVHSQPSVLLLPLMCSMFAVVSYGCSVEVCCIEYN